MPRPSSAHLSVQIVKELAIEHDKRFWVAHLALFGFPVPEARDSGMHKVSHMSCYRLAKLLTRLRVSELHDSVWVTTNEGMGYV